MRKQTRRSSRYQGRQVWRLLLSRRELDRDSSERRKQMAREIPGPAKQRSKGDMNQANLAGIAIVVTLKKESSVQLSRARVAGHGRIGWADRSGRRKSFCNKQAAERQDLTPNHLSRRPVATAATILLPISLPNFGKSSAEPSNVGPGGGGSSRRRQGGLIGPEQLRRKFRTNGLCVALRT